MNGRKRGYGADHVIVLKLELRERVILFGLIVGRIDIIRKGRAAAIRSAALSLAFLGREADKS